MKIGIVLGTRPEILKLAPLIFELEQRKINYFVIHTGQHYSENMDSIFWKMLEIPPPKYKIEVRERTHARQTAEMLRLIDEIFNEEQPDWVVVQGDTNSTMAGALAASKHKNIRIAHLEAGLRSFDRTMPEEINRVIVDHIADLLLAPTIDAMANLTNEGIPMSRKANVGNTVEDLLMRQLPHAQKKSRILKKLNMKSKKYVLLTAHRQENTESLDRLSEILNTIFQSASENSLDVIFPIHPRTRNILEQARFKVPTNVQLIEPVGYSDFLILQKEARLVATDSGGVQEETCILGVPCITLRENTERPETIRIGSNRLVGVNPGRIASGFNEQLVAANCLQSWTSPYGGGKASERTVDLLIRF
jgi:UDP-N-acetylglucosamine 2-epimerase (non-hydrolysing)